MGLTEGKQIPFLYDVQPEVLFSLSSPVIPFCTDGEIKKLVLPVADPEVLQEILFKINTGHIPIDYAFNMSGIIPATLGMMDKHTLGELDPLLLDIKAYEHSRRIIFGNRELDEWYGMFDGEILVEYPFKLNNPISFSFDVGEFFMEVWYIGTKPIRLYFYAGIPGKKATTTVEKEASGSSSTLVIDANTASAALFMMVRCKSIWTIPLLLGEMDPYTLGALDPYMLTHLDNNIATALRIGVLSAEAVTAVSLDIQRVAARLSTGICSTYKTAEAQADKSSLGLVAGGLYHNSTLGELDGYQLVSIDPRTINLRTRGRVSLTLT